MVGARLKLDGGGNGVLVGAETATMIKCSLDGTSTRESGEVKKSWKSMLERRIVNRGRIGQYG